MRSKSSPQIEEPEIVYFNVRPGMNVNDVEATTGAESRVNQAVQFFSLLFVLDKA